MTFQYAKIETSIEDTSFEYVSNLDDYKAMHHILNVMASEKLKYPELIGIFNKLSKVFDKTIERLNRLVDSDGKSIDVERLATFASDGSVQKILLVRNEDYNCFATYPKGFEESTRFEDSSPKTVYYNVGQLETSGSVSVIPNNANVFLSSMLYSYALLHSDTFYKRQNLEVFINIAKTIYAIILQSFGKKSGLLVGSRIEKEMLFFLTCSFIFSIYARKDLRSSDKLQAFLRSAASNTGSSYLNEYLHKISNVVSGDDIFSPDHYSDMFKYSKLTKNMGLLEMSESDMKIQLFRLLGIYGVLSFENYPRFTSYMIATHIPNPYFTSTTKMYNKASYQYLVEYYLKELFNY